MVIESNEGVMPAGNFEVFNPSGRTIPAGTEIVWSGDIGLATLDDGSSVTLYSSKEAARQAREN